MDVKQTRQALSSARGPSGPESPAGAAALDAAVLYRRAVITKIRLRQAIFRAHRLALELEGPRRTAV